MKKLLQTKHWVYFILMYILPLLLYFSIAGTFMSKIFQVAQSVEGETDPDPSIMIDAMQSSFKIILPTLILMYFCYYAPKYLWRAAVGLELQNYIPKQLQLNKNIFLIFFGLSVLIVLYSIFQLIQLFEIMEYAFSNIENIEALENSENLFADKYANKIQNYTVFSYLSSFILLICNLFLTYFTAKTIKTAELQRKVTSNDYIGYFFAILFFFVGVWIVQPVINDVVNGKRDENFYL